MRPPRFLAVLASLLFCAWVSAQSTPLWLRQPALSPDGKTVVFGYQGVLYKVPSLGGPAVPLTLGEAHHSHPVWSHDGKWLAFASDRHGNFDVFVMPAQGGEARRLTHHSAADLPVAFSADDSAVMFTSQRMQSAGSRQFPSRTFPQTCSVPRDGGMARMICNQPLEAASVDPKSGRILYQDVKGYEDPWRKHHTSAVTRDIWQFQPDTGQYQRLTTFPGEDRNPVASADGASFYYLSEREGSFNVFKASLAKPSQVQALTHFSRHPVRFLSAAQDDTLCYTFDGEIYLQKPGAEPAKLEVQLQQDGRASLDKVLPVNGGITELAVAPSGKEFAFVARGEVFVASADGKVTRRITTTPGQERSVSFSPDGRSLLFAAERGASWDILSLRLARKDEPYFYAATQMEEKVLVGTEADEFQPKFSPDGKEVAYLEGGTALKVLNLASGRTRTVLPYGRNYSYADGDQEFCWSPDSRWLLLSLDTDLGGIRDIGLVAADGTGSVRNLSRSGFDDGRPNFSSDGSMLFWASDREGYRNLGQEGTTADVYGIFLTRKAWDRFRLSKEDFALVKEREEREEKERQEGKGKDAKDKEARPVPALAIDWDGLEERKLRLSAHTADLVAADLSKAGDKLFYLAKFEKGYDLWSLDLRSRENKLLLKLDARHASMERTQDGKAIFLLADGKVLKVDSETGKREDCPVAGEMVVQPQAERAYIFEHAWRQVQRKFYVTDLHGVDWPFYHDAYRKFLPHIRDNYAFQELLSEMLGELNGSHTGARFNPPQIGTDATACLGLVLDAGADPRGPRIAEVLKHGPFDLATSRSAGGQLILAIDGVELAGTDFSRLLNRKAGQNLLVALLDPKSGERWEEVVKPITAMQEGELLYRRWVERNREDTLRLSNGRLGYVHVRAMNDASMRTVIDEALGRHVGAEALVVDTRFNGGGNIHEQLSDFLSGKKYFDVVPRGLNYGHEPAMKWIKPSIVLMSEGNYSDAHLFPVAYKLKGLGRTVGMPVPGTGTFVWWETQIDPTLVFGIPQGGWRTPDGKFCENNQLEPDIEVVNEPAALAAGRDPQLEAAVHALLDSLKEK